MRKISVALMLVIVLSFALSGCGMSAEDIIKETMRASKEQKTASFETVWTIKLPRAPIKDNRLMPQNLVQKSYGLMDFKSGDEKTTVDLFSGVTISMLQLGDKQYWELAGNWYEVPQDKQAVQSITETLSISQYLKYFKEIAKLGDANIEGDDCYHIRATPDMEELVKLPGVTDLLKNPQGEQTRTVDEITEMKAIFDFYIMKSNFYIKREVAQVEYRAGEDFIKGGYAEAGDMVETEYEITFDDFDKNIKLEPPATVNPFPAQQ